MLKLRIIPTLLFNDLKLVKGISFNGWRTVGSIMQSVRLYNLRKVDELILLDISATNQNDKIDLELVNEVASECFMPLTFGGGIKTIQDISNLLKAGADKICINTEATKNLDLVKEACEIFGSQCIVVSIDYKKNKNNEIEIYSNSGKIKTNLVFEDYSKKIENIGAGEIILTSIDRDGTMKGYDLETISYVSRVINLPVIASGGAGEFDDIYNLVKNSEISGLAAASIYHFTDKTPLDLKKFLISKNIPIRL